MLSNWIRVISSIGLFVGAGVCEIGGGWFVWKFRKEGWHWIFFILGSFALVLYGLIPTFQSQPFGRTYAAYGGFFIGLSLLWGWVFDSQQPDRWDLICAAIAVGAVIVMISVPRNPEAGEWALLYFVGKFHYSLQTQVFFFSISVFHISYLLPRKGQSLTCFAIMRVYYNGM
jgi:small multidrug resistance family-3 protein